jgi:hypothetical protein
MAEADKAGDEDIKTTRFRLSLDAWAVALALALSVLIRLGLIKSIPW